MGRVLPDRVSKKAFNALDAHVWRLVYKWGRFTHANKPTRWVTSRYFGTMDEDLLGWAVDLWRCIARSVPDDHPNYIVALNNLGNSLEMLGARSGSLSHLDEAVEVARGVESGLVRLGTRKSIGQIGSGSAGESSGGCGRLLGA